MLGLILMQKTRLVASENKGTAFSNDERKKLCILGQLPYKVETLKEQATRAYMQYQSYNSNLKRSIYLRYLYDHNTILFYKLVNNHLKQMLPIIYTPVVDVSVRSHSREFRQPQGLYLSYPDRDHLEDILKNYLNKNSKLLIVTDGEGVLGIGDQGIGAMDILIAKTMVYTLCGGINPNITMPIMLDVGTDNQSLLKDPCYLGWRNKRLHGKQYHDFITEFVAVIKKLRPKAFLHWEDFGFRNARRILETYCNEMCTFNGDMQGTGVVTLAALLAAVKHKNEALQDQRFIIFGPGTAGLGIAEQICSTMVRFGISMNEARSKFWMIDKQGLLIKDMSNLTKMQSNYARNGSWTTNSLEQIIQRVHPTVLIGCSGVGGAFSKIAISTMAENVGQSIIFPLSNPTKNCEAMPSDLLNWTKGHALIATGSLFNNVVYDDQTVEIAQCNNALSFPGIGLGIIAAEASKLTNDMLHAACIALSEFAPITHNPKAPLLPSLSNAREVAKKIAIAVAKASSSNKKIDFHKEVSNIMWEPEYK